MGDDRRDDWHNSVDARLVNLTSAQKSADADLDKLRRMVEKADKIFRGDPSRNIKGLIEQANHLENEINKFDRIFDKDYLGHGGLISFITYVYEQQKYRDQKSGYKWGWLNAATMAIGSVIVSLIGLAGFLIVHWGAVSAFWNKYNKLGPLEQRIEQAKHPKAKHKVFVTHVVPMEDNGSSEKLPQ